MITSPGQRAKELYEFGPFRVDAEKETLLREGEPVPLTPKTFQILLVLIRHNEEVVTKDDLMKTVWPDTFVEEANLSRNIFMLRKALGETAQDHKYIVTVPGRGYRLAENVHLVPDQEVSIVSATHQTMQVEVKETKPWPWGRIAAAVLVVMIAAAGIVRWMRRPKAFLGEKDTVVVADFANSTGDKFFDQTLRQGLAVQLEQSPILSLISDQRVTHTLKLMGQRTDAQLTPEIARQVCLRTGSAAVLEGSIAPLGSQYVVGLRAKNCRTGEVLDEEQVQAAKKEDVLNALGQIASRFRTRVGESVTTIKEHNTPLAEATTSSPEAWEAYSEGWKVHYTNGATAALPFFKRAVELDPEFAMAHAALGRMYADIDESDLSAVSTTRAWELRERTSDPEKFFISAAYDMLVTGNLERARDTVETWLRTYPRSALPRSLLAGYIDKAPGQFEAAAAEARKVIDYDPDFWPGHYNYAANNSYMGRQDEAERAMQEAANRGIDTDEFIMLAYDIAFVRGDRAAMDRAAARGRERTAGDTWISSKEAYALAYAGRLQESRTMTRRAVEAAKQVGQVERAGLFEAGAAVREAFFGEAGEAKKRAAAALEFSRNREVVYGAAFALALTGDSVQARTLADDLEKRFPEDTTIRLSYLPALRGQIALNRGDVAKALEMLQEATPYELGTPRSAVQGYFGAMYPVYVRGEAYLAEGKGVEAAGEFKKILDRPGIVVSDPVGVMARLGLGRALGMAGDTGGAKKAYEDLLGVWSGADEGLAIVGKVRREMGSGWGGVL